MQGAIPIAEPPTGNGFEPRFVLPADLPWLIPLLVFFAVKGLLLIAIIGPFTGHDEVDHFYYVERLAQGNGLGVVGEVSLPPEAAPYRAYVADYPNNAEVIQPPLYHLLLVPIYWLVPGNAETKLDAMRLVSVAIGVAVVLLAYLTAALIFPREYWFRAGVPISVALQPQFSFEAAIVNHDILLIALSALLLFLLLRWYDAGYSDRRLVWIGVIAGAGLWTKASMGLIVPVIGVALVLSWREQRLSRRWFFGALARSCGLALLIASPWFLRSFWHYGDPTGARRLHDIPDYGDQAASLGSMLFSAVFWRGRLEDFWGNFGWRLIPLDPSVYNTIYFVWSVAGIGVLFLAAREVFGRLRGWPSQFERDQWRALALLSLWVLLTIAGVLYVGTIQFTQSRFAFPGMIGFAALSILGYGQIVPRQLRPAIPAALFVALLALNVVTAVRFLIPYYYGESGATVLTR